MRGVRLPLPRQPHQIHRTARDRDRSTRPRSQALLDEWNESRFDEEGLCAQAPSIVLIGTSGLITSDQQERQ